MCGFTVYTGSDPKTTLRFAHETYKIKHRGPDNSCCVSLGRGWMAFHRLSIMDVSAAGNQPLTYGDVYLTCNGEIYNNPQLRQQYADFPFKSGSDCESIIPLYLDKGIEEAARSLDGEFALVIYDARTDKYLAARDPIGIRGMFYGYTPDGQIAFASEMKALHKLCTTVMPFPPGHYYDGHDIRPYIDIAHVDKPIDVAEAQACKMINKLLTDAVAKRLQSDAPVGFLLSGGLDSSLVCAIAAKIIKRPIQTFAIGIEDDPIDTKYARIVADYLGCRHTEVLFSRQDIFNSLHHLIYLIETFDITTIRASMGMYLICKYISEHSDVKVLMTGEISDELFGYKYTDFAPSAQAFQDEAAKRIRELYMYDVLRADRCISANGLEARVPFGDIDFVKYVMAIVPEMKMNRTGMGKYLLRKSFEGDYLPREILYREKAAFSDAVGHSSVDYLKRYAEEMYTDAEFEEKRKKYTHVPPISKESLLYREIFEEHFPGRAETIKDFWMPNKEWDNCNVNDPSARVLPNYGKSGE